MVCSPSNMEVDTLFQLMETNKQNTHKKTSFFSHVTSKRPTNPAEFDHFLYLHCQLDFDLFIVFLQQPFNRSPCFSLYPFLLFPTVYSQRNCQNESLKYVWLCHYSVQHSPVVSHLRVRTEVLKMAHMIVRDFIHCSLSSPSPSFPTSHRPHVLLHCSLGPSMLLTWPFAQASFSAWNTSPFSG